MYVCAARSHASHEGWLDGLKRRTLSAGDVIKRSECLQSVKIVAELHGFWGEERSGVSEDGVGICLVDGKIIMKSVESSESEDEKMQPVEFFWNGWVFVSPCENWFGRNPGFFDLEVVFVSRGPLVSICDTHGVGSRRVTGMVWHFALPQPLWIQIDRKVLFMITLGQVHGNNAETYWKQHWRETWF